MHFVLLSYFFYSSNNMIQEKIAVLVLNCKPKLPISSHSAAKGLPQHFFYLQILWRLLQRL